jgi:hypothetical protein
MATFTQRINNDNNDGYKWPTSAWNTTEIKVGKTILGTAVNFAVRFTSVSVPAGATINSAKLTFQKWWTQSYNLVSKVSGIDEDNTADFSSDPMGRAETTAKVDWDANQSWVADTEYDTPDLTTIVQEIVDRGGWADGNSMGFFIKDDGQPNTDTQLAFYDYNRSTTRCAFLTIDYTGGTTTSSSTSTTTSSSSSTSTSSSTTTLPLEFTGMKISKQGKDVLKTNMPNDLIFSSQYNTLKYDIEDNLSTSNTVASMTTATKTVAYTHNLKYFPFHVAYVAPSVGGTYYPQSYANLGASVNVYITTYITTTQLVLVLTIENNDPVNSTTASAYCYFKIYKNNLNL